ncbi:MAG: LysR family transcriptional regulator [Myxococcales bacterium 68-20]|nr:LysR family transcriptional regulator [Myxococcales bacterium]OJY31227.1 MAG: LysR family transcriptional regulator [Myxococcales bacterium 68-20]
MHPRLPNVALDEILIFTRVVQGGSFTAAATAVGMPKSTVSRKVAELEARIGARLLQRTTRTVSLTDVGRVYYEHCVRIVAELEEAQLAVSQLQSTPRGLLRVTAPMTFSFLGPIFAEYLGLFPEVQVDLLCTDRIADVVEERFDLALRAGTTPDTSLVARRLGVVRRRLVAAPEVAKALGAPKEVAELEGHPCIAFAPEGSSWELRSGTKSAELTVFPRLVVNDYAMLRSVARAGFGIALLPEYLCAEDLRSGRLVPVLESWSAPEVPVFALYPSTRHLSPKVVALLDLLRQRLVLSVEPLTPVRA